MNNVGVDEAIEYLYDKNDRLYVESYDDVSQGGAGSVEKTTTVIT